MHRPVTTPAPAAAAPVPRRALLATTLAAPLLLPARPTLAAPVPPPAVVLVAGATGETGSRVVRQLAERGYNNRAKAAALGLDALPGVTLVDFDITADAAALTAALGDATAVVCAAGARAGPLDAAEYARVDEDGTIRFIAAAAAPSSRVDRFLLLSSILTNGAAVGQRFNPAYLFLQAASGRVLTHKLAAERALASSGLDWGVLRPGGLTSDPPAAVGGPALAREDSFFGTGADPGTRVSRDTVAAVLVGMLALPRPSLNRVVEVVGSPTVAVDADVGALLMEVK